MTSDELTICFAQRNQPWAVPYSLAFLDAVQSIRHLLATHAVLHAMKTVGKLAAVYESLDHEVCSPDELQLEVIRGMAADLLVTIGLRLANLHGFDLATELVRRVEEKNGVNLLGILAHGSDGKGVEEGSGS